MSLFKRRNKLSSIPRLCLLCRCQGGNNAGHTVVVGDKARGSSALQNSITLKDSLDPPVGSIKKISTSGCIQNHESESEPEPKLGDPEPELPIGFRNTA